MFRMLTVLLALFFATAGALEVQAKQYRHNPSRNNGVRYCYNPNCTMCNQIWGPMSGYRLTADWRSVRITAPQPKPATPNVTYTPRTVIPNVTRTVTPSVPVVTPNVTRIIQPQRSVLPIKPIITEDPDTALLPTPMSAVDAMLRLVEPTKDQLVCDLGCGDGRIVVHAAKVYGSRGFGIEINPETVKKAKERVSKWGVEDKVTIVEGDILKYDFQEADIITIFLFPDLIEKVVPLIKKPGTVVISANHDIPGKRTSKRIVKIDEVDVEFFIWEVK